MENTYNSDSNQRSSYNSYSSYSSYGKSSNNSNRNWREETKDKDEPLYKSNKYQSKTSQQANYTGISSESYYQQPSQSNTTFSQNQPIISQPFSSQNYSNPLLSQASEGTDMMTNLMSDLNSLSLQSMEAPGKKDHKKRGSFISYNMNLILLRKNRVNTREL